MRFRDVFAALLGCAVLGVVITGETSWMVATIWNHYLPTFNRSVWGILDWSIAIGWCLFLGCVLMTWWSGFSRALVAGTNFFHNMIISSCGVR